MNHPSHPTVQKTIDPHYFGALTDAPVMDTGVHDLFPGEDQFLSKSAKRSRKALLTSLQEHLDRVCQDDEQLLYVAIGQQSPSILEWVGLGWWFYTFHRVALVFTDRRLIEVLLDLRGKRPLTRMRSFAWSRIKKMKAGMGSLIVKVEGGPRIVWRMPRADRKVVIPILERVREKLDQHRIEDPHAVSAHRWLCPECGVDMEPKTARCSRCQTQYRSRGLATLLALALPGGGLYYAGRPVMGTIDLLGETLLFLMIATGLVFSASVEETVGLMVLGTFLFGLTKIESIHLSHMLVNRSIPETPDRRGVWRKVATGGAALSVLLMAGVVLSSGTMMHSVQKDLTFLLHDGVWEESRERDDFLVPDAELRSQWMHFDGAVAFVNAYPIAKGETWDGFQSEYVSELRTYGLEPTLMDTVIPDGFTGFRCFVPFEDGDGGELVSLNYWIYDDDSTVVHQIYMVSEPQELEEMSYRLADLVSTATWIDAVEPQS